MSAACESSILLIIAALKHYFFLLYFFIINFFKSCSLFNQILITALTFSFLKYLTVMSARNCNNALIILKSLNNLLFESFLTAKIHEISALTSILYKVFH